MLNESVLGEQAEGVKQFGSMRGKSCWNAHWEVLKTKGDVDMVDIKKAFKVKKENVGTENFDYEKDGRFLGLPIKAGIISKEEMWKRIPI